MEIKSSPVLYCSPYRLPRSTLPDNYDLITASPNFFHGFMFGLPRFQFLPGRFTRWCHRYTDMEPTELGDANSYHKGEQREEKTILYLVPPCFEL